MINDDWSMVMTWQANMRERERERSPGCNGVGRAAHVHIPRLST